MKRSFFISNLKKTGERNGYTDLELSDGKTFHVILEAKRGWILPGRDQLNKYAQRPSFLKSKSTNKYIVSLSECSQEYAKRNLPFKTTENGIPVSHISWKEIKEFAEVSQDGASNEQKHLLKDFLDYLGGIMTMQKKQSNMVYIVSYKPGMVEGTHIDRIELIDKGYYYCPRGIKGWPKDPPNYIAFRYKGKLYSIHHIDNYTVTKNVHDVIDIMPDEIWENDHFVFDLGPAIKPNKTIRTGKSIYRGSRVWAAIDPLLTCDTISEAVKKTQERD